MQSTSESGFYLWTDDGIRAELRGIGQSPTTSVRIRVWADMLRAELARRQVGSHALTRGRYRKLG